MAESEKQPETIEEAPANPNADAPKKNAVAGEPSHLNPDYEDSVSYTHLRAHEP